jgi:hypothetical protein
MQKSLPLSVFFDGHDGAVEVSPALPGVLYRGLSRAICRGGGGCRGGEAGG